MKKLKRILSLVLAVAMFATSFQCGGIEAKASEAETVVEAEAEDTAQDENLAEDEVIEDDSIIKAESEDEVVDEEPSAESEDLEIVEENDEQEMLKEENFELKLDANGGTFNYNQKVQTITYPSTNLKYSMPKRDGYVFTGWYAEPECNTLCSKEDDINELKVTGQQDPYDWNEQYQLIQQQYNGKTLYAGWGKDFYTVTIILGNPKGTDVTKDTGYIWDNETYTRQYTVTAMVPKNTALKSDYLPNTWDIRNSDRHYVFADYYTDAARTEVFNQYDYHELDGNITLYAGYEKKNNVVTLHAVSDTAYFTTKYYDEIDYNSSNKYNTCVQGIMKGSSTSFYLDNDSLLKNTNAKYAVEGLYTEYDAKTDTYGGKRYNISEQIYPEKDMDLYIKWASTNKALTLDANGGYFYNSKTGDKTTELSEILRDSEYNTYHGDYNYRIYHNDLHFGFEGWAETKDATKAKYQLNITDGGYYNFEAKLPVKDTTLYAVWKKNTFNTVTFHGNGGKFTAPEYSHVIIDGDTCTGRVLQGQRSSIGEMTVSKEGYTFLGWYADKACTKESDIGDTSFPISISKDVEVYAKWARNYNVTFDLGNGKAVEGESYILSVPEGSTIDTAGLKLPANPVANDSNKSFAGWYADAQFKTPVNINDIVNTVVGKDITYYAKYTNAYTVTFDAREGKIAGSDSNVSTVKVPEGTNIAGRYPTVVAPDKKVFKGWFTADGKEVDKVSHLAVNADITLYAEYSECYTVTFHSNKPGVLLDGKSESISVKVVKGEPIRYAVDGADKANIFSAPTIDYKMIDKQLPVVHEDYNGFVPAYSTSKDGSGKSYFFGGNCHEIREYFKDYTNAKEIDSYGMIPTSDMDFYVIWNDVVTVKFDGNGKTYVKDDYVFDNLKNPYVKISDDSKQILVTVAKKTSFRDIYSHQQLANSKTASGEYAYVYNWHLDKAGKKEINYSGSIDSDITYYANWKSSASSLDYPVVKLHAGEGYLESIGEKTANVQVFTYDYHFENVIPSHLDSNKTFTGWYLDEACTKLYNKNNQKYKNGSCYIRFEKNVKDLYAGYGKARHIKLDANGGYFDEDINRFNNPSENIKDSDVITLKEQWAGQGFSLADYEARLRRDGDKIFEGWYLDEACTKPAKVVTTGDINQLFNPKESEVTLYAKWVDYKLPTIKLNETKDIKLDINGKYKLKYTVNPADCGKMIWVVQNVWINGTETNPISIASDGTITGLANGQAYVHAEYNGVVSNEVKVVVGNKVVEPDPEDEPDPEPEYEPDKTIHGLSDEEQSLLGKSIISFSCDTPDVEIYYTLDGTNPSRENGIRFTEPFTLTKDTTVKYFACKNGYEDTSILERKFVIGYDFGDVEEQYLFKNASEIPTGLWYYFEDNVSYCTNGGILDITKTYTGSKITLDGLKVYDGNKLLTANVDYTVSYANNINAAAADSKKAPTVTVTGKGNYSGKAVFKFTIEPQSIEDAVVDVRDVRVKLTNSSKLSNVKPVYTLYGKKLILNKDYVLKYYDENGEEILNPAKVLIKEFDTIYTIKAEGKDGGNYAGTISDENIVSVRGMDGVPFYKSIKDVKVLFNGKTSLKLNYDAVKDCGIEHLFEEGVFTVKYGKKTLEYNTDYTIEPIGFSSDWGVGTHAFRIVGIDKGFMVDEETGIIQSSYLGEKNVSLEVTGTPLKNVKIAGLKTTAELNPAGVSYEALFNPADKNLDEYWSETTLYTVDAYNEKVALTPGEDGDYDIIWNPGNKPGKYNLTFKGRGKYTGQIVKQITLTPINFKNNENVIFNITMDEAYSYIKNGVKPVLDSVKVSFNNNDYSDFLEEGKDYTVSYKNNNKIVWNYEDLKPSARPTVVITGKGLYAGWKTEKYFNISKAYEAELSFNNINYNAKGKKGYFLNTKPIIKQYGHTLTVGKNKDVEPFKASDLRYYYEDDTELENGKVRKAGTPVKPTDRVPTGTVIRVKLTVHTSDKSCFMMDGDELTACYKVVDSTKNISAGKYKVEMKNTSNFIYDAETGVVPTKADNISIYYMNGKQKVYLNPTDFEIVSAKNNNKVGTAKIVIQGKGEYHGTKTVSYKINKQILK